MHDVKIERCHFPEHVYRLLDTPAVLQQKLRELSTRLVEEDPLLQYLLEQHLRLKKANGTFQSIALGRDISSLYNPSAQVHYGVRQLEFVERSVLGSAQLLRSHANRCIERHGEAQTIIHDQGCKLAGCGYYISRCNARGQCK
jgi:hypothetical protein